MLFTIVLLGKCKDLDMFEDLYKYPSHECVAMCPFGYHDAENRCYPIVSSLPSQNEEKLFGDCFPTGLNNGIQCSKLLKDVCAANSVLRNNNGKLECAAACDADSAPDKFSVCVCTNGVHFLKDSCSAPKSQESCQMNAIYQTHHCIRCHDVLSGGKCVKTCPAGYFVQTQHGFKTCELYCDGMKLSLFRRDNSGEMVCLTSQKCPDDAPFWEQYEQVAVENNFSSRFVCVEKCESGQVGPNMICYPFQIGSFAKFHKMGYAFKLSLVNAEQALHYDHTRCLLGQVPTATGCVNVTECKTAWTMLDLLYTCGECQANSYKDEYGFCQKALSPTNTALKQVTDAKGITKLSCTNKSLVSAHVFDAGTHQFQCRHPCPVGKVVDFHVSSSPFESSYSYCADRCASGHLRVLGECLPPLEDSRGNGVRYNSSYDNEELVLIDQMTIYRRTGASSGFVVWITLFVAVIIVGVLYGLSVLCAMKKATKVEAEEQS